MPTFPYDNTNPDHEALVEAVLYKADLVLADGQTPDFQSSRVYDNAAFAMRAVLAAAPREAVLVESEDASGQGVRVDLTLDPSVAHAIPPAGFHRFLELRLGSWNAPLVQLDDPTSTRIRQQYLPATQTDTYHPVGCRVPAPAQPAGEEVRCWPLDSTLEVFRYVPETAPENVSERLREAIHLRAAAATMRSRREEGANILQEATTIYLRALVDDEHLTAAEAVRRAEDDN